MQRSHIQRNEYTKRNSQGLHGTIELELNVKSDYLHVGSGKRDVELIKPIKDIEKMVNDFLETGKVPPDIDSYFSPISFEMVRSGSTIAIPGSTIKGLVRSRLELSIPGSCYIVNRNSNYSSSKYIQIFKPVRKQSDSFDPRRRLTKVCPVCDLLGNRGLASKVDFSDFLFESGNISYVSVEGSEYEVVTKGSKFTGKVVYYLLKPVEIGMVLYGLGFRVIKGNLQSKTLLLGRFKFSDKKFGRVYFTLKSVNNDYVKYLQDFINAFNPLDFNEEW